MLNAMNGFLGINFLERIASYFVEPATGEMTQQRQSCADRGRNLSHICYRYLLAGEIRAPEPAEGAANYGEIFYACPCDPNRHR